MADAALSKSLDDLIKEQREKKPRKPKAANKAKQQAVKIAGKGIEKASKKRGGGGGGKRNKPPRAPAPTSQAPALRPMVVKMPKNNQRRGPAPRPVDPEREVPGLRAARLDGNAPWQHDMHQHAAGNRPRGPRAPSLVGTKLYIYNLDFNVTNEDVKELFETIGPLVSHRVHYDRAGRSQCTAEVVFADRAQAVLAQKKYHGIELDGKPMTIDLIEKQTQPDHTLKSGIKITGGPGRTIEISRGMATAVSQALVSQPRGRGSIRSMVETMQMD